VENPSYNKEVDAIIERLTQELGEEPSPFQIHNAIIEVNIKGHLKWRDKLGGPEYHFCSKRCSTAFHDKNVEEAGRKFAEGCEQIQCPSCGGFWRHEPDCDLTDFQRENI
jgi:YHS domain-containing protein